MDHNDDFSSSRCRAHEDTINRILRILEGNGREGLVDRVNRIETDARIAVAKQDTTIRLIKWQIGVGITLISVSVAVTALFIP